MRLFGGKEQDPRDELVAALRDENAHLRDTQGKLLAQIADLTNKLSAHADAKAHAAAMFQQQPPRPPDDRGRPVRMPPGVAQLTSGNHLNLGAVRRRLAPARPTIQQPPPAED